MPTSITLPRDSNQALGLGQFAIDFLAGTHGDGPSQEVLERTRWFHTDAVLCGLSALALQTNAPTILRNEALDYPDENGATVFGSKEKLKAEKAVVANCAAVREWDSNGTNFGYRPELGHTAGEFGHNDFYPVCIAACQQRGLDGATALKSMVLLDEIRGRLAEVFSLKSYKIDHVVHGAIGSAATYGALMGATAEQIESAIGMVVSHYIPWRAIRAGKQLSDSKGASAAISTEAAILSVKRSMAGFIGPKDIFRNPEAIFRYFEPTTEGKDRWKEAGESPFDLVLSHSGDDFAVMGMHFKLGLYEHQSAGALQGVIDLLATNPNLLDDPDGANIGKITITAYEPAFGIIGNPMKKNPTTRQSADHSMAYIVSTLIRKALEYRRANGALPLGGGSNDEIWKAIMLMPYDYQVSETAIHHPVTRSIMDKIKFRHGGAEYDAKYPEGIPTSVQIYLGPARLHPQPPPHSHSSNKEGAMMDSGLIMFPAGHSRNDSANLQDILRHKWQLLGALAFESKATSYQALSTLESLASLSSAELQSAFTFEIATHAYYE